MTKDAIRYTIRGLPKECVMFLKAQRAHTGRNIGLLVAEALAHWVATHVGLQGLSGANYIAAQRPSDGVGEMDPVRLLDATLTDDCGAARDTNRDRTG